MRTRSGALAGALFAALVIGASALDPTSRPDAIAGDEQDVDALVARLVGDDPKSSAEAADALVAMGVAAIPRLTAATELADARPAMLETLGRIAADHDEAVAPLLTALGDKEPAVRAAAARGLALAGPRAKTALAPLTAAMRDTDALVRVEAAAATLRVGGAPADPGAAACVVSALRDGDATVRRAAVRALPSAGLPKDRATPAVLAALQDIDVRVRTAAIGAATAIGLKSDDVAEAVAHSTRSPDPAERAAALAALPGISSAPIGDLLRKGGALRGDRVRKRPLLGAGGSPQTEAAVAAALDWLARHQASDGSWSADKFANCCNGAQCAGTAEAGAGLEVGVTGLAVLAFLGAGESHLSGPHKEVVARGIEYLRSVQDADGCVGPRASSHFLYGHAIAMLALCEASMLTCDPAMDEPAERAVAFALKAKNPTLGWRYVYPPNGDNDTSVTGWMTYALAVARAAEIHPSESEQAIGDAMRWVDKMTEPKFGRTGYQMRGGPSSRFEKLQEKFPLDKGETLTSIGILTRVFAGHQRKEDDCFDKGGALIAKKLPKWDTGAGTIDFVYWFWGSLATRQLGGVLWTQWNSALKTALVANQARGAACSRGSWEAIDAWSVAGGRVYATAMCCLCLETYYRMDRMLDGK